MDKNNFCSFPFDTIFLGADGIVKNCCSARDNLGDLNKNTIEEVLQSETARRIRRNILNGKWDMKNCSYCYEIEQSGAESERQSNLFKLDLYDEYKKETDFKLRQIDLRWNNTCNLACNYCYEYFSSIWEKILNKPVASLKDTKNLLDYIEQNYETITHISLLGGEPLLQKPNHELFNVLKKDIGGFILTNLSVPIENNKIANKILDEFPEVKWGVSFENVGDRFEYVRHNAKWETMKKNLAYITKRRPNGYTFLAPVYDIYNAFNLMEYYDYVTTLDVEVYWHLVIHPDQFRAINLPMDLRKLAYREIQRVLDKYGEDSKYVNGLKGIQEELLNHKVVNHKFLEYTKKLETEYHPNKKNFKTLWPILYKRLQKFEKNVIM